MSKSINKTLSKQQEHTLLETLEARFKKNMHRHKGLKWEEVKLKLENNPKALWTISEMERTGGEPDVVLFEKSSGALTLADCAPESPSGRRSLCFDEAALAARKENKPAGSALHLASEMGITLLTEEQYRQLQALEPFDLKTSSWIQTPAPIRKLGGALFADRRYDHVFVYHNGVQSYYGARGFRGICSI